MAEYTRFTALQADKLQAGVVKGTFAGLLGSTTLSKAADYTLAAAERTPYIGITLTAAGKTVTLGLETGEVAIVVNEGASNAFTLKNVSGDTGTSLAAGNLAVVKASKTANGSKVYVLN